MDLEIFLESILLNQLSQERRMINGHSKMPKIPLCFYEN